MGYTIKIGNAVPGELNPDEDVMNVRYRVESVRHEEAPAFGEPTDHTNSRWPSYSAWADSAREADLTDLLVDTWCKPHPGCVRLKREHLERIQSALTREDLEEWTRNRLVWCEYWARWALDNCALPAVENS